MRRPAKESSRKLTPDGQRLLSYALAMEQSSSRLEERSWEAQLDGVVHKLLKTGHQDTLDTALERAFRDAPSCYDTLMSCIETGSESCEIEHEGVHWSGLLVAAPILAWTRYSIPAGPIHADLLATLSAHFYAHILAPQARMVMAPTLYAIDQLPQSHAETYALTQQMAQAVLAGSTLRPLSNPPETAPFLADTRYLMAVVMAPRGEALFNWQATLQPGGRDSALVQWRSQVLPNISRLLPGCGIDVLLPEAYYVACRDADKQIRPASIRAAVHFLTHTLEIEAKDLQAILGGFGDEQSAGQTDEYRIGFGLINQPEILYGVVWPLFGPDETEVAPDALMITPSRPAIAALNVDDEAAQTPLEEILFLLHESGIVTIKRHDGCFAMESCDDCGAPLFLNPEAELVHAEMPDEAPQGPTHFH